MAGSLFSLFSPNADSEGNIITSAEASWGRIVTAITFGLFPAPAPALALALNEDPAKAPDPDKALSQSMSEIKKDLHQKKWLNENNNLKKRVPSLEEIKFMQSWEYKLIEIEHKNNKVTKQIEALEERGFKEAAKEVFEKSIEGKGYTQKMYQHALTAMGFGARARSEEEIKFMKSPDYLEHEGLALKVYALTKKGFKEAARELIIGDKEYQESSVATRKYMLKVLLREVQDETVIEFMGSDRYPKQEDVYEKVRVLLREGSKFGEGSKNKDPLKLQSFKETALELLTSDKGFQGARPEYRSMFLASIGLTAEAEQIKRKIDKEFGAIRREGQGLQRYQQLALEPSRKTALSGLEKKLDKVQKNNPKWGVKTPRTLPPKVIVKPEKTVTSSWGVRDLGPDFEKQKANWTNLRNFRHPSTWGSIKFSNTSTAFVPGTIRSRNATKEEYDEQEQQIKSATAGLNKVSVPNGDLAMRTVYHPDGTRTSVIKNAQGAVKVASESSLQALNRQKEENKKSGGGRGMGG